MHPTVAEKMHSTCHHLRGAVTSDFKVCAIRSHPNRISMPASMKAMKVQSAMKAMKSAMKSAMKAKKAQSAMKATKTMKATSGKVTKGVKTQKRPAALAVMKAKNVMEVHKRPAMATTLTSEVIAQHNDQLGDAVDDYTELSESYTLSEHTFLSTLVYVASEPENI